MLASQVLQDSGANNDGICVSSLDTRPRSVGSGQSPFVLCYCKHTLNEANIRYEWWLETISFVSQQLVTDDIFHNPYTAFHTSHTNRLRMHSFEQGTHDS